MANLSGTAGACVDKLVSTIVSSSCRSQLYSSESLDAKGFAVLEEQAARGWSLLLSHALISKPTSGVNHPTAMTSPSIAPPQPACRHVHHGIPEGVWLSYSRYRPAVRQRTLVLFLEGILAFPSLWDFTACISKLSALLMYTSTIPVREMTVACRAVGLFMIWWNTESIIGVQPR